MGSSDTAAERETMDTLPQQGNMEFPDSWGWGQFGGFHPTNPYASHYAATVMQHVESLEQEERELLEEYMGIEHEGLTLEGRETLKGMREILSKMEVSADDIIVHACDVPGRNPRTRHAVDISAMVTMRCEELKVRLQGLDMRLNDTLLQAEDMCASHGHHTEAHAEYERMSKEIEEIMKAHEAKKTSASKTWSAVDYVMREDTLKKHAVVLQLWQDELITKGNLPQHNHVRSLWAKIMAVEVLSAEDRHLKNELMYGPSGCQFFYEHT